MTAVGVARHRTRSRRMARGVTLIEVVMTAIIGAIAILALAGPVVAERTFWATARSQTEAQRDAQMAMQWMARVARASTGYDPVTGAFQFPCGTRLFRRNLAEPDQLELVDQCNGGAATTLINGTRSEVTEFAISVVGPGLIHVQLDVRHEGREHERLETTILLRNA